MGFFTDTSVCIGCKACEVACKQWNDLPADGSQSGKGVSYDHTGDLSASTWRHVRFVELFEPSPQLREEAQRALDGRGRRQAAGDPGRRRDRPGRCCAAGAGRRDVAEAVRKMGDWVFMSDVCKHCTNAGCLDACPTGALIRTEYQTVVLQPDVCNGCGYCVPACPFGVVDRDHIDGRAGQVHALLRPPRGRAGAGLREVVPDRLDPVRPPRGARGDRLSPASPQLHERGIEGAYLYGAGDEPEEQLAGGLGSFFLLTEPPERYGLPAHADSPVQENVVPATLAAVGAGLLASAGRGPRVRCGRTPRPQNPRTGDLVSRSTAGRARSSKAASRRSWLLSTSLRIPPAPARPSGWPTTTPKPATANRRWARAADRARGRRPSRGRRSRSRALTSATLAGRISTRRATPAMPTPNRLPVRSPRRTGGCVTRRSRTSMGRSSTHPCGAGRSRPTSGSAGWRPARRSSRSPATSPATTAPPRSPARSRSAPSPPRRVLLIADLGRPERFLNMTRIFKPRSPMNTGAWCLVAFSGSGALAVGCDLIGRPKAARALGRADRAARQLPRLLHRRAARLHRRPAVVAAAARSSDRHSSPPRPRPARPPPASCSWRAACRTGIRRAGRSARSRPPRC